MTDNNQSKLEAKRERKGMALGLSGGGFRASLFHLGVLRRLNELGLLSEIDTISSVSGGSILAGYFADRIVTAGAGESKDDYAKWLKEVDWEKDIAGPFRKFVSHDIRTVPFFKNILWNWKTPGPRIKDLENRYKKGLTELDLQNLPSYPNFIFCATDITFGVNWEFSKDKTGDYQAGFINEVASDWPVARAVAASSSFPPIFGPMVLRVAPEKYKKGDYTKEDRDKLVSRLSLSDGGVYDNMGLEPIWKNHKTVVISDCGAPFAFKKSKNYLSRLARYTSVIMNQTIALRKRMYFTGIQDKAYDGTYFSIGTEAMKPDADPGEFFGYSRKLIDDYIAEIRTDLDAFTLAEMDILENHGYFASNYRLLKYMKDHIKGNPKEASAPYTDWTDEDKVRKALESCQSSSRFSLKRFLKVIKEKKHWWLKS